MIAQKAATVASGASGLSYDPTEQPSFTLLTFPIF